MRYKVISLLFTSMLFHSSVKSNELEDWAYARAQEADGFTQPAAQPGIQAITENLLEKDNQWMREQNRQLQKIQTEVTTQQKCGMPSSLATDPLLNDDPKNLPSSKGQLLIFVSLSMPKQSLQAWADQADKAGGALVLRGLVNNSLKQTVATLQEMLGPQNIGGVSVDPSPFKQFKVQSVPAVVVTGATETDCQQDECSVSYDMCYGDVGLTYALKKIAEEGDEALLATEYLSKLNARKDKP